MMNRRTGSQGKLLLLCVVCACLAAGCDSQPQGAPAKPEKTSSSHGTSQPQIAPPAEPAFEEKPISSVEGTATWYDVPEGSLPETRAPGELTAAHNKIPQGKYVRVTNLRTDKSVVVRITDNGVGRNSDIDLSKDAAESIDIVERGVAKVRIEVLKERAKP